MLKTILSIILFVIAGGLVFVYASPEYTATQKTLAEVALYTEANSKVREVQELRNALTAKYREFSQPNIARLQSLLPDHVDNVKLVLDLDGIAARRGIRIGNVSAKREDDKNRSASDAVPSLGIQSAVLDAQKYKSLVLEFTVIASYNDFVLFMRDLEQSLRIVDLVSLKMEPVASRAGVSNLPSELRALAGNAAVPSTDFQYSVSIKTYWLPPQQ
jgi:Tfp pilus assembly protein PilO